MCGFSVKWFLSMWKRKPSYWLTRFVLLRVLGVTYFFAFLAMALQVIPLIGHEGLLPADVFLDRVGSGGSIWQVFWDFPNIFWIDVSDGFLLVMAWLGVILSLILLCGFANVPLLFILWILYFSFDFVGQLWLGYGWEIQLTETGFLAMFLVPIWDWRPFPRLAPPHAVIWLFRWLAFRIHIGAALIKVRGDACWRDLSCLFYHYETQPIPGPLSPYFHYLPKWINRIGVFFSHVVQGFASWFVFFPGIIRTVAGVLLLGFQVILILSGNLSFLNWITIVPIIACFDDTFLARFLPKKLVKKAHTAQKHSKPYPKYLAWGMVLLVVWLSIPVVQNLISKRQMMNTSFNQWHLVNTYGAFGSITKERFELIIQGTSDEIITPTTEWMEYEFPAKPGAVDGALPIIAPYQPRLDWQIWFAAFSIPDREPWIAHLIWQLLSGDEDITRLLAYDPFPDHPPRWIRVEYYKYEFAPLGARETWTRTYVGSWLRPLSLDTPQYREFIEQYFGVDTSAS